MPGDTILVGPGIYKEQVTITQTVSLIALSELTPPTIDATGLSNGIFVNGMPTAPDAGLSGVVIKGFRIHNANFEGILVANGNDTTIVDNHVSITIRRSRWVLAIVPEFRPLKPTKETIAAKAFISWPPDAPRSFTTKSTITQAGFSSATKPARIFQT
jgi:hypothetical protein